MTTYSFINAPTLARDLARHEHGASVLDALLLAFSLDDEALADLDRVPTPPGTTLLRDRAQRHAVAQPAALPALARAREAAGATGLEAWTSAVDVLDAATLGRADGLCRWVRTEVLAAAWRRAGDLSACRWPAAVAHVCDGLLASWVGPSSAAELGRPWQDWSVGRQPAGVDDPRLARLVAAVGAADSDALADVADAMTGWRRAGRSWARLMHEACWAVDVTGRGRTVTVAQLHAVGALLRAASRPRPDLVAAVTMAVHATAVADVLPDHVVATMCRPLFAHCPPLHG